MNSKGADSGYVDFTKIFHRYLKSWKLFLVSIILCTLVAFVWNKATPDLYKIESKFLIEEDNTAVSPFEYNTPSRGSLERKISNGIQELKSKSLASQVFEELKFDVEYYEEGLLNHTEIYAKTPIEVEVDWTSSQYTNGLIKISWLNREKYTIHYEDEEYTCFRPDEPQALVVPNQGLKSYNLFFGAWAQLPYNKIKVTLAPDAGPGEILIRLRHKESLLQEYTGDKLQISLATAESSILLLSVETRHPLKGSDYLNMLMQTFLKNELEQKNAEDISRINFINRQISGVSDSLTTTERELKVFRSRNQTQNIASEGNTLYQQIAELRKDLSSAQYKGEYYDQLESYLASEDYNDIVVPSGLGVEDPVLNRLITDLIALLAEKSRFLATQTENSPNVREVNRKLIDLNSSIKEVLRNVKSNNSLLISDLESRINTLVRQYRSMPQTEQDLQNIKREYTYNENLYTYLLERRAASELSLASNTPSNKIIDLATPNFTPLKLRSVLNYVMAVLLGTIFSVLFIFIRDQFSVKVEDLNETEQQLDVPVLGRIAKENEFTQLSLFHSPHSKTSESIRSLRTNINFIYSNKNSQVIMITSSVANEGKTFCALNLAAAYSTSGKRTIYVSCDLYKNKTIDTVESENGKGLSQYLSGQISDLGCIITKTDYDLFDVIMSGPIPPNPVDLLVNEQFKIGIMELRQMYDVIILDTPPIGLANETLPLTLLSDINVYLIRQHYSKKEYIEEVNNLSRNKEVKNLFVVFNDVRFKSLKYGGYSYGYEHEKDTGSSKSA